MTTAGMLAPTSADERDRVRSLRLSWPLALVALAALGLAIGIAILDASPVGVAVDDSMYVILAKSLATGQGFRFLNLPGAPAATHFPPGYPALLALLWRIAPEFPANLMVFKAANAVCVAIIAVGVARFARRRLLPDGWSLAAGALSAASVPVLVLAAMLMSEPFFLSMLLLLLPTLESFVDPEPSSGTPTLRSAILVGIAIGVCMLIRTHAIVLVPTMALLLCLRRRWRDAAVVSLVAILCLLPWQVWSARHATDVPAPLRGEYGSYLGWWVRGYHAMGARMIPMTLERTVSETLAMFATLFSPARTATAHAATLVALAVVAGVGIATVWRRIPVTLLFLAGYLTIIALWPFPSSRFVWGVWPLLLLLVLPGAHRITVALRQHGLRGWRGAGAAAAAAALIWIACGYASYETRAIRGRWWASIPRENTARIVPVLQWTLANTAPSDVVSTDDDGTVYLYTGRRTVPVRSFTVEQYLTVIPPRDDAEQGLVPILATYPVRVVIVGSSATFAGAQWLAAQPAPLLTPRDAFTGGAAFTVLPR